MSAERTPPEEHAWLARLLRGVTRAALRYPRATLIAGVGLALAAALYTALRLEYRTSRVDLLSRNSEYNQRWLAFLEEFGENDDAVIVVEGTSANAVRAAIDHLAEQLHGEERLFRDVLHRVDLSRLHAKGLHFVSPSQWTELEEFVAHAAPVIAGDWSSLNFGGLLTRSADANAIAPLLVHLRSAMLGRSPDAPQGLSVTLAPHTAGYFVAKEGRLGFILLRLAGGDEHAWRGSEAVDALRATIAETQSRRPDVRIGLTGLPVMEYDEMRTSQHDMSLANVLSFVGVSAVFVAILGGWRHPLWTSLTLLVGMAWSFGYVTLVIGHLNILSVAFSVFLIGLGMDFGIHYVARYLQLRVQREACHAALERTAVGIGPGITTGAVTTALSFFTAGATDFPGVAELGVIAGGGILLCFLATVTVLPALLVLSDERRPRVFLSAPLDVGRWMESMLRRPGWVLAGSGIATVAMALGAHRVWYDYNLLNLQSVGLESVDLERKLLSDSDQNTWYAVSVADDPSTLFARKAAFEKLPTVDRVDEIVSLLGKSHAERSKAIARLASTLRELPNEVPLVPVEQPAFLAQVIASLHDRASSTPSLQPLVEPLAAVRDLLFATRPEEYFARVSGYQQAVATGILTQLRALREASDVAPPSFDDLPPSLVTRFRSPSGKHLLKIYGRGDIWNRAELAAFIRDLRTVDPDVTGQPLQAFEASREMKDSYLQAVLYAFIGSCLVLAIDFRRPRDVMLALLPLGLGMLQMFGIMGWLDIPLNPANMLVLPLVFGIGIDEGVHILHDYRSQTGPYRMSNSTAVSVLLSALQEIVGFGSLMVSQHQGLQSLGRVLTLGMTCSMFASLVMLPALLAWFSRRRQRGLEGRAPIVSRSARATRRPRGAASGVSAT